MIMAERLNCLETDRDLGRNGAVNSRYLESCKKHDVGVRGTALCAWQTPPKP